MVGAKCISRAKTELFGDPPRQPEPGNDGGQTCLKTKFAFSKPANAAF